MPARVGVQEGNSPRGLDGGSEGVATRECCLP